MKQLKKGGRIIMVPYPALGHVGPMQKLGWAFVSLGFEPVIVVPQYIHRQIINDKKDDDEIKWVGLADGLQEEGKSPPDFFGIESTMENRMPGELEELVLKLREDGEDEVVCMVVDLLASWAIEVAHRFGIPAAGFWPVMLASYLLIASIPDLLRAGLISDSGIPQEERKFRFLPELPIASTEDLPWLIGTLDARKSRFKFWKRTLERTRTLKWLLVNSFPEEEHKLELQTPLVANLNNDSQEGYPHVLLIGPIFKQQLAKSVSFWEEEEDLSCLGWLKKQKKNSVVYISFGSWVSPIGESKLKNLAMALEASGRPFIWVLRPTWRHGLPLGFLERVSKQDRGRVVSWAPQTEILQNESVGCFITHCGWSSTVEALQCKKKLLCYPVAGDQFVNCAYIVQVWRVGFKLNGLALKDIEDGLTMVMEDVEMDTRLEKLHERIMGVHEKRGAFLLRTFVENLKKAPTVNY